MENSLNETDILKEANILKKNLYKAKIKDFNYNPFLEPKVNIEDLNNIKLNHNDVNVAKDISNNVNRIVYARNMFVGQDNYENQFEQYIKNLENIIKKDISGNISSSGLYLYPPNGYCGWHTNSTCIGERIYLSWCKEGNKSFFRYINPKTKELHTKWEKEGWNINRFKVSNEEDKLFWHCVYSDTIRLSIGFNLYSENVNKLFIPKAPGHIIFARHAGKKISNYGDWSFDGKEYDIILEEIEHLLIDSKIKTLNFDEIAWKGDNLNFNQIGINCICCNGKRFLNVDMDYPPIVIKNAPNPSNKLYRLIDGKHRLMKMKIENIKENKFYVLEYHEINSKYLHDIKKEG